MRTFLVFLIALTITLSAAKVANSCGDKTMRVGGGLRFHQLQAKKNPSSILIHAPALPEGNASRLQDFFKAVGHRASTFGDINEVSEGLKTGQYDLVLTNLTLAPNMQKQIAFLSSRTVVVPVTLKRPTLEDAAVARQYKVIVKNPKYAEDFLPAIIEVMKSKSKRV